MDNLVSFLGSDNVELNKCINKDRKKLTARMVSGLSLFKAVEELGCILQKDGVIQDRNDFSIHELDDIGHKHCEVMFHDNINCGSLLFRIEQFD